MADSTSIEQPFPIFFNKVGKPLDSGYVYIGEYGKNPQTNLIQTFWDEALTQPAVQPIRTINGYYSRYGTPSRVFIQGISCSITVRDKYQIVVYSDLKTSGKVAGLINASVILDDSGQNQQQINDKTITTVKSIADLIAIPNPKNGQVVYVKSYHVGLNKGGSNYIFKDGSWGIIASNIADPEIFGAKGGLNDDQQVFTSLSTNYTYALGKEYTVPVWRGQVKKYIGNNTTVHLDSVNGDTTVCLQIRDDSNYSDINFINNPNEKATSTYAVVGNNSIMNRVGFFNFDDLVTPKNSWGILLEDRRNIIFNQCFFGGNGLSDIAIVDRVYDLTINNASNVIDGGVILDIEPNQTTSVKNNVVSGINVNGGHYKSIHVLENSFTAYGIKDVNINNASIDLLELRGGVVNIRGSAVKDIKGNWYPFNDFNGYQNEYFGSFRISNAEISKNLIKDPQFFDAALGSTTSYWSVYAPVGYEAKRVNGDNGSALILNSTKTHEQQYTTRGFIDIPANATHIALFMKHSTDNGADPNFNSVYVELYDSSNIKIQTLSYKGCRVDSNQKTGILNEQGIFRRSECPNAVRAKISITCKPSSSYTMHEVGLFGMNLVNSDGNFNAIIDSFAKNKGLPSYPVGTGVVYVSASAASASIPSMWSAEIPFKGVKLGDIVNITSQVVLGSSYTLSAFCIADDAIRVTVFNHSSSAIAIDTVFNFSF